MAKFFASNRRCPELTTVDLTRRESQIMEILYRRRRATVEAIRAELPDAPSPSSVRKLLEIMIERGLLAREYDGPRHVYFPAVKPEEASRSALKQLVRTFFDNSPGSAIAALLDMSSTQLSAAEYRRLSSLLKRVREPGDESMSTLPTDPALSAALSIIVKASVLVAIAAAIQAWLQSRSSAAARHLVWTLAIVSVLALPILGLALPEWPLVIRRRRAGRAECGTRSPARRLNRGLPVERTAAAPPVVDRSPSRLRPSASRRHGSFSTSTPPA